MKWSVVAIILVIALIFPYMIVAETENDDGMMNQLDLLSDEVLHLVKAQKYEEASRMLNYFTDQFVLATSTSTAMTRESLRTVTSVHQEVVEEIKKEQSSYESKVQKATKLRILMDALSPAKEPMWHEMKGPMLSTLGEVRESIEAGDSESFHTQYNTFLSLYDTIYPSLKLEVEPATIQQLHTRIQYIDQYRRDVMVKEEGKRELELLNSELEDIFDTITDDEADPSLWWVIISTGSIIILTLSYVGFKKYKGGKKKEKNPES